MPVVLDPYDPTGMFSKTGRISQEMYQMIQKKEEILNFQPVFHRRKKNSLSMFNIESLKKQEEPIRFSKKLGRGNNFLINQLNEKRFESFELPPIYSKSVKILNVSLNRAGRTKSDNMFFNAARGLQYKPNYYIVWKIYQFRFLNLKKLCQRRGLNNASNLNQSILSDYKDDSFNAIRKRIIGLKFDKMISRERASINKTSILREINQA